MTPVGSGSNFFVYNSSGLAEVNVILGHDSYSVPDYVFFTTDENIIETHATVKLTRIE